MQMQARSPQPTTGIIASLKWGMPKSAIDVCGWGIDRLKARTH